MSPTPRFGTGTDLSRLITDIMTEEHDQEYLEIAQQLFKQTITLGEVGLRQVFNAMKSDLLRSKTPFISPFNNYHDFLEFIYQKRIRYKVDRFVRDHGTKEDKKYYDHFRKMFPKVGKPENVGFQNWLKKHSGFTEVIYVPEGKVRPAHMIVIRRKDTNRLIEKIAEGIVTEEYDPVNTCDIFGIKVVAPTIPDAKKLVYDEEKGICHSLIAYGLERDGFEEPIMEDDLLVGKQPPGIDNHYHYGCGNDHLIQINANSIILGGIRFEIAVTDAAYFLIDEMEHFAYRRKQERKRAGWTPEQNDDFDKYVARAKPLADLLEPERKRILVPGQYFPGEEAKYHKRLAKEAKEDIKILENRKQ